MGRIRHRLTPTPLMNQGRCPTPAVCTTALSTPGELLSTPRSLRKAPGDKRDVCYSTSNLPEKLFECELQVVTRYGCLIVCFGHYPMNTIRTCNAVCNEIVVECHSLDLKLQEFPGRFKEQCHMTYPTS